jgi:acetamidase/formamidase
MAQHDLDDSIVYPFWDNSLEPRLTIDPGDTVVFQCRDASGGQITPASAHADLSRLDLSAVNPLTGPVSVRGAEPGDALEIEVVGFEHAGWGWNGIIPGFGLLADEFPEPYLHHWRLEDGACRFGAGTRIALPYSPFCGMMGVGPAEPGRLPTVPPGRHGGNLDNRGLVPGARLRLPVLTPGALFSTSDCHASQGDGEVCGTGIETPMRVTLSFGLLKGANLPEAQFLAPPSITRGSDQGFFATTAHGPDLYENSRQAVRYMINYLCDQHGLTRQQAYVLCSAIVDLRVSQVVDMPNWMITAYLPLSIFKDA